MIDINKVISYIHIYSIQYTISRKEVNYRTLVTCKEQKKIWRNLYTYINTYVYQSNNITVSRIDLVLQPISNFILHRVACAPVVFDMVEYFPVKEDDARFRSALRTTMDSTV